MRDLQRAPEFDQSAMFKKVYEEEYGVFGGAPFGALSATTSSAVPVKTSSCWRRSPRWLPRRTRRFPDGIIPRYAEHDSFTISRTRDMAKIFDSTTTPSGSFRQSEDSRYGACACRIF